ncbi:PepSY domain-containing protein [Methylobacterium oxalidis]|uniref:PepSY domain-containing protein n=1 Tax=Methylobacterium oxalidis TaxID=944322 RepID=UPI0033164822
MPQIALSLASLLFLTGVAAAQTSPATQVPPPGAASSGAAEPAHGTRGHKRREHEGLQNVKVSLAQALDTAESKGPGRAIEADFGNEGGKPFYEVKLLDSDSKLTDHHIDANSGQVTKSDTHPIESYFVRLKPSDVQNAPMSLKQAVATAEQTVGGRAAEAEVEREASSVQYKIKVMTVGQSQEITVEADGTIVRTK